jgi:hypothetical protein
LLSSLLVLFLFVLLFDRHALRREAKCIYDFTRILFYAALAYFALLTDNLRQGTNTLDLNK